MNTPATFLDPCAAERLDPAVRIAMARTNSSMLVASAVLALTDWAMHLAAEQAPPCAAWRTTKTLALCAPSWSATRPAR